MEGEEGVRERSEGEVEMGEDEGEGEEEEGGMINCFNSFLTLLNSLLIR